LNLNLFITEFVEVWFQNQKYIMRALIKVISYKPLIQVFIFSTIHLEW